ncbi:exosome complex component RRP40 [Agrilus planipennis]|uniref:Exosome complex component RRP40 n=1 Tax=Agrilus planipennis TaxID=224129 RepID=A0A1W4WGB1_AGRPL|nr:exosome complex component RRP40 [Agrilus planipennis]
MVINIGDVVYPGDTINNVESLRGVTLFGPGLHRSDKPNKLQITRAGILSFKTPNVYWVESLQKRYVPKKGDLVVGVVSKKAGDVLKVDICSSELASLSTLAFEGATKKQRPDLQVGDCVYARLLSAHREMEPELVCVDSYYKAGKLGPLSVDGFLTTVSLNLVNRLLNIENPLLRTLGKKYVYEIAVGMNGRVWINARSTKDILAIVTALQAAEHQSDKTILEICRKY